jgi:hypothetical protein
VPNSTFGQIGGSRQSGTLYAGGTVALDNSNNAGSNAIIGQINGYVVAQAGATINVSGYRATINDIGLTGVRSGPAAGTAIDSWSDAGTVSIYAGTTLWDGTFVAKSAGQGNAGTFILGGGPIFLQQAVDDPTTNIKAAIAGAATPISPTALGNILPASMAGLAGTNSFGGANLNVRMSVDKLADFDNVFLFSGVSNWKAAAAFTAIPTPPNAGTLTATASPLTFVDSLDWTVKDRLSLAGLNLTAGTPGSSVTISAPYVLLTQTISSNQTVPAPVAGTSTLNVYGQTIDVESAILSGFSNTYLNSAGDLRLSTQRMLLNATFSGFTGQLTSAGNITLTAQRIYPVSDVAFTVQSTSSAGRVMSLTPANFSAAIAAANAAALAANQPVPYINPPTVDRMYAAPAGSSSTDSPLSAGASLTVLAPKIEQNGNLFVPLGRITLGDASTQTVTIDAGSRTSVTLGGQTVPFGQTEDGTNWFYYDDTHPLLTASGTTGDVLLPSKAIAFNGTAVNIDGRSTIDLRGGGDIQAMEFVPGKGGTSDVLAATASQPNVYALVPSQTAPVAAFDKNFSAGLGDVNPLAGQQIYLQGGNGIAAGLYTLYPAHYATLPCALRVVDYGSALAKPGQAGHTLPDGTQIIAGYTTQSTNPAARSSGTELFKVQTNAVWRQYSEIDGNSANAYFAAKAQHDGTIVPYLPMDAGRLAINAQQSLNLIMGGLAGALTAPAAGGRGSELDLSASQLALLGPGQTAPNNYVGVDVTQLGNFESVLVGGLRSNLVDGSVLITPFASQVLVDTQGAEFAAPEIILIATPTVANTTTIAQSFTCRLQTQLGECRHRHRDRGYRKHRRQPGQHHRSHRYNRLRAAAAICAAFLVRRRHRGSPWGNSQLRWDDHHRRQHRPAAEQRSESPEPSESLLGILRLRGHADADQRFIAHDREPVRPGQ